MAITRRAFVRTLPAAAALPAACRDRDAPDAPDAAFVGQSPERGHLLRDRTDWPPPSETIRTEVLVVGAGAAGAAAVWALARAGISDLWLLELEDAPGGTARSGELPRSAHPMGAHYLPAPPPSFRPLFVLLRDLGLWVDGPPGDPLYDGRWLAPAPLERVRFGGMWHEGLAPVGIAGDPAADEAALDAFFAHLRALARRGVGSDGRPLFAFPARASSRDLRHLDRIDFATYLRRERLASPALDWLADYACRDDYGLTAATTSAFAALHHFLARGLEQDRGTRLLVSPRGNDALVRRMLDACPDGRLRTGHVVVRVDPAGAALAFAPATGRTIRFEARSILWAAPRFVLRRVLPAGADPTRPDDVGYTPWRVSAVEVDRAPGGIGAPLSWDNVDAEADHLGYVLANHGETGPPRPGAVLVLYEPFCADTPKALAAARRRLLRSSLDESTGEVLAALEDLHPGIGRHVRHVRIARWGHAMIRPRPGYLFGGSRERAAAPVGAVRPCAADAGGLPLFEEAFAAGIEAAAWAARRAGRTPDPSLALAPA